MLPRIGRPEAASGHHADARDARLDLVHLAGDTQQLVVVRHRAPDVDAAAEDLLGQRLPQVDHLDVAVEGNAVEALVAEIAVVEAIGVVEVVERQLPLLGVVVELGEEARRREVAEPGREELQRIERGVAGDELRDRLVVEAVVRDGDELDLDAGQLLEGHEALGRRFLIGRADGEAYRLAGLRRAHGVPIDGADPVLGRVPEGLAGHRVEVAIVLADVVVDRDLVEHRLRVGQVLRQREAGARETGADGGAGGSRGRQQRAAGEAGADARRRRVELDHVFPPHPWKAVPDRTARHYRCRPVVRCFVLCCVHVTPTRIATRGHCPPRRLSRIGCHHKLNRTIRKTCATNICVDRRTDVA